MPTRKQLVDAIFVLHDRFSRSDDGRIDEDYLAYAIEQARAEEILKEYNITKVIDQNWLVDFGIYPLTKVNFADDPSLDFCKCDIMKFEIPSTINLTQLGDGNLDLGLKVISACGKTSYTYSPLERWKMIPSEHVQSKFGFYSRFGRVGYVNKLVNELRFIGIPETIDGLVIKRTMPVISGNIKTGVVYQVKGSTGTVTYNGVVYMPGDTFTGIVSITTFTAGGSSQVFYNNFQVTMTENDPYPVSSHMARNIVLSVLTKELQLESKEQVDMVNDSIDDVIKTQ
jgi:hypothetical protein